ncbi:MAG TPA: DUF11 domain-containing protein, partial [Gemmataceae bacterium]|nr:DUF11 domain-containing protein [Gemmataceae bacterium]
MFLSSWNRWRKSGNCTGVKTGGRSKDGQGREQFQPRLEGLETRIAPALASFTKNTVPANLGSVAAGSNITYAIQIQQDNTSDFSVLINDATPPNTTFVSAAPDPTNPTLFTMSTPPPGGTGQVQFRDNGNLPANETDNFTIVLNVDANAPSGPLTNTAQYTSSDTPSPGVSASTTVNVAGGANVSVTKTENTTTVTAGTNISYTVTVSNSGPGDAQNVSVTDAVPANATFVSESQTAGPAFTVTNPAVGGTGTTTATIATLSAGSSATFVIVDHVVPSAPGSSTISNTADVSTTSSNSSGQTTSTVNANVATAAHIVTVKTGPASVTAGTDLTYTITLQNAGPSDAQNMLLTDSVPANTTFVSFTETSGATTYGIGTPAVGGTGTVIASAATVPANETDTFVMVVHVSPATPQTGGANPPISNTASASSSTTDPNPNGDDTSTALTNVLTAADLSLTKTGAATVTAGTELTYTLTLNNGGPSDAQNVAVTDALPAGTTFVAITEPANFVATTPAVGSNGTVTFDAVTVAAGENDVFTITVLVASSVPNNTTISNTATATTATTDPTPNDNNNTSTFVTTAVAVTDLGVTKTGPATVTAGANVTYTITLTNNGPSDAQGATLSDAVPANTTFVSDAQTSGATTFTLSNPPAGGSGTITASAATFVAGDSATFEIVVHVVPSAASGSTISNTATASSTTTETGTDHTSTVNSSVAASADLTVAKTAPGIVTAGTDLTYTITLNNNGPSDAQNVVVSDVLPANTSFVSETHPAGFTSATNNVGGVVTVTESTPTFTFGAAATFTIVVHVSSGAPQNSVISNTAQVTSTTPNPNPADSTSTAATTVTTVADMAIVKTGPATVTAGTNLTYTLSVTNNGPSDAQNVSITDVIPGNTTFVSETQTGGPTTYVLSTPPTGGTGTITDTAATVAAGANDTFVIVLQVSPSAPDGSTINNTASVGSTTADSNPQNNASTTATTVA